MLKKYILMLSAIALFGCANLNPISTFLIEDQPTSDFVVVREKIPTSAVLLVINRKPALGETISNYLPQATIFDINAKYESDTITEY